MGSWGRLTCHSFRHAFGTHLYENGTDLLTIKALLGHKSLNSTTLYVHLASNGTRNAVSPFDQMGGTYDLFSAFVHPDFLIERLAVRLYAKDWCPYIKETFNGFGNAIEYLGRYTHKVAISNSRRSS